MKTLVFEAGHLLVLLRMNSWKRKRLGKGAHISDCRRCCQNLHGSPSPSHQRTLPADLRPSCFWPVLAGDTLSSLPFLPREPGSACGVSVTHVRVPVPTAVPVLTAL